MSTGLVVTTVSTDAPVSYQQFLLSDHYDYFRTELSDAQQAFLDSFKQDGFPHQWTILDVLSRLLDWDPSHPQSNLGDFQLQYFHMLAMVRRGEADARLQLDGLSQVEVDAGMILPHLPPGGLPVPGLQFIASNGIAGAVAGGWASGGWRCCSGSSFGQWFVLRRCIFNYVRRPSRSRSL